MSTNKKTSRKYSRTKNHESNRKDYAAKDELQRDTRGKNDLSWHAKSEALLRECASIPWSWATGRNIKLGPGYDSTTPSFDYTMPGIMAIRTVLTPGAGIAKSDALNIAAQAIYTDIRRMLKSANQYESSDVMIYLTSVGEVMAYIGWLTRLYATTMMYSFKNSYLPDDLIRIQGVDPSDLHNRALEFLSRANQLIAKASQIYIPKGLDFLERCRWEYANYYSEGNDIKDQIYVITPGLFRRFTLFSGADYKGTLKPTIRINNNSNYDVDTLLNTLEIMIDSLIGDSDFANIAGDLMNRYGEGGVMTFSLIPQDAVMSVISGSAAYEVLEQIQNSRCLYAVRMAWGNTTPEGTTPDMFWVMQGEGENQILTVDTLQTLDTTNATIRALMASDCLASLLTVHEEPSSAKTMLITRMQNMIYGIEDALTEMSFRIEAAAEFVVAYEFVSHKADGTYNVYALTSTNSDESAAVERQILETRVFHYAPTFYLMNVSETGGVEDIVGSLDIIAPITVDQLRDINRVDLMSLFAVPDIGKVTG